MNVFELGAEELDALREVANIGAGHAATALSQLTNRRILVEVPTVRLGSLSGDSDEGAGDVATVRMQVLGDVTGETLQVFPYRTARRIAGILTGSDGGVAESFGDMERSALVEAGNIIAGAYLNALSDFMGMLLLMSVPTMRLGGGPVSAAPGEGPAERTALILETHFQMEGEDEPLQGQFVLVPDPPSIRAILDAINVG
ncbi:MAG TPA: chemotaxis protein CheC [Longimicrobiales bacterium]|nr:chemotaxis protein CheC [Longimicrobiales bacterium]